MRLPALLILTGILFAPTLLAQGLLYDPVSFGKVPSAVRPTGEKDRISLPLRVDWSPYCPVPARQTGNTCVAYATAYGAYAIQRAIETHLRDDAKAITDRFALSPIYPLLRMRQSCASNQRLEAIADHLAENGDVWHRQVPGLTCADPIPAGTTPQRLVKKSQSAFRENENKAFWTKYYLSLGLPVVVGLEVADNFRTLTAEADYYDPSAGSSTNTILHAVVVVGYDEFRKAFKLMNSYGPAWGQGGFFWLKYAAFERIARCGIIMPLADSEPVLQPGQHRLGGTFRFVNLTDDGNNLRADTVQPTHLLAGLYELSRKDWKQGDLFQLITRNTRSGEHLCVFSFSLTDTAFVHYPRQPKLPGQPLLFGADDTDLMPISGYQLIIPSPDDALVIQQATTDYLCVLYSTKPLLADLPGILERLRTMTGDAQTRLYRALGPRLVTRGIRYQPDRMAFSATFEQGDIVPLLLEVKSIP